MTIIAPAEDHAGLVGADQATVGDGDPVGVAAEIGKDVVGCAALYRTKGNIAGAYCIGTAPQFRGRGVAATMVS